MWHELRFGCARLARFRRREAIERYLDEVVAVSLPVLDYDRRAADWHALERARLVATARIPPFVDGQIAAIARVDDLILGTSNKADFQGIKGLHVRIWEFIA